jgi:RimJ/RimL family protein N-acetyltransferase
MSDCIKIWLNSYTQKDFIRFSIIDKRSNYVIGTIDLFVVNQIVTKSIPQAVERVNILRTLGSYIRAYWAISICKS